MSPPLEVGEYPAPSPARLALGGGSRATRESDTAARGRHVHGKPRAARRASETMVESAEEGEDIVGRLGARGEARGALEKNDSWSYRFDAGGGAARNHASVFSKPSSSSTTGA